MTLVETALVISAALMVLFGIFEYGRFIMTRQLLENAAREGARYAVVHTYDKQTLDVQDVTLYAMAGQESQLEGFVHTSNVQVYRAQITADPATNGDPHPTDSNWKNTTFGEPVAVRITGNYRPILPSFLFIGTTTGTIPLEVTAVMYSEAN
jgi:Flp pilus assembly protein TadG